jgi:hypothetical protein
MKKVLFDSESGLERFLEARSAVYTDHKSSSLSILKSSHASCCLCHATSLYFLLTHKQIPLHNSRTLHTPERVKACLWYTLYIEDLILDVVKQGVSLLGEYIDPR